ncbi:hypothetical protein BH11ARM2_BH11ARM2_01620 [soil metagenome]
MNVRSLLPVTLAALLVGCQVKEANPTVSAPVKTNAQSASEPPPTPGPTESASAASIPAELKHEGYEYYGLGNDQPVDMEVRTTSDSGVRTGSQITRFKGMQDGKAVYSIERTGGLTDLLGQMDVTLEPDGIFVKSSSVAKVGDRDMEMPAKLSPGTTWEARTVVEQPGRELNVLVKFKVVGPENIKTPVGDRSTLRVDSTGEGTLMGKKVRMDSQSWYVKGFGMVKSVLKYTGETGAPSTITIQETK